MSDKIQYTLVDSGDIDEQWAIQLDDGPFEGITYQYSVISFDGEDDNGNAKIKFTYEILEDAEGKTTSNKKEFEQALGLVLSSILQESFEEQDNGQHGVNNSTELDSL